MGLKSRQLQLSKRAFDVCLSILALLLLSPVIALVAVLVRIFLGSPILFLQVRPGRDAKPFTLLKFRTMSTAQSLTGESLADAQRMTAFGLILRSTSLDELPELINVIRGEMSLVGPRPLLSQYLVRYSPEQSRRHQARPGITGWAQINGRNALAWEQKLALDVWYIDHQSFGLDLRILVRTAWLVFKREGISQAGHVTMPEFFGTPTERDREKS